MVKSLLGYELVGHVLYNSYTKFMFEKVRLVFRNVIVFLLNTMMHSSNNTLLWRSLQCHKFNLLFHLKDNTEMNVFT